ncbi:hypothetical protein CHRYSEOSP005_11260 [Chryseobacterium sp. Alg-005]|uniref:hypothetical protein n=1 Tax=Chryseobacterium sp. Alg-005 TaxID=3159516 RepID=UPI003555989B
MIQFLLMLFGLAFSGNNVDIPSNNNSNIVTVTSESDPGTETGGDDGDTGGNTGQKPPAPTPETNP